MFAILNLKGTSATCFAKSELYLYRVSSYEILYVGVKIVCL